MKKIFFLLLFPCMFLNSCLWAAEESRPIIPCAHPAFRGLDFWIGDWQVFHRQTDKLAGFDRVSRTLKGCAIQQSWISLDNFFSSPLVPFRMNGKSLTAFNGREWVQFWVDNQAGSQITKGGFEDGILVLTSETPVMDHVYRLSWERQKDGSVHHLAQRKKTDSEKWQILFDFIYRRNNDLVPLPPKEEEDGDRDAKPESVITGKRNE